MPTSAAWRWSCSRRSVSCGRKEPPSLDHAELGRLRDAVANWRTGEKVHGPKPDD